MSNPNPKPEPPLVTDKMVEIVGSALYIYWNDVSKGVRETYSKRVRAALEKAFAEPEPEE